LSDNIYIGDDALTGLAQFLQHAPFDKVAVLVDDNTFSHCYPQLAPHLPDHHLIRVPSGEMHKNLETCSQIWTEMTRIQLSRNALLINVGGGVIGDMGGFCAGVYKRGIAFVQVPTTLLSQVDASVGGKTGVDFMGFKNHLGVFQVPEKVFIFPGFLQTLSAREIRSGYAEIIKHWFIAKAASFAEQQAVGLNTTDWAGLIQESVAIKAAVVTADPLEKGLRKVLNFGHTIGHAIETFFLNQAGPDLLHGEAIAIGMICESYLSARKGLLQEEELKAIQDFILTIYGKVEVAANDLVAISELALQDKKNTGTVIKCTLLNGIGQAVYDQPISLAEIQDAIRYYTSL
jgi:3-dehydroquinate synthase